MIPWKFRTFVSHTGRNDVQDEIDGYDEYAIESFSRAVQHLAITPKVQWHEPQAKKLKNEDPIYEIRYQVQKRATRALGYFQGDDTFTIVLVCYHKGKVYKPPDAFKSAHGRIAKIEKGDGTTIPLKVFGETFPSYES